MSLEKSGLSTHNDEAAHQDPSAHALPVRTSIWERVLLAFSAASSSLSISLLLRQLRSKRLDLRLPHFLTSLRNSLATTPVLKLLRTPSDHEIILCAIVVLVTIYCYSIVRLFAEQPWRAANLPRVLGMVLPCLLIAALLTKDLNTVFLEVLTGTLNMGVVGGIVVDIIFLKANSNLQSE